MSQMCRIPPLNKKVKRNQKIINLYFKSKRKYSYLALANIFHITPTRIGQIISDYQKRKKKKNGGGNG